MLSSLNNFWDRLTSTGTDKLPNEREKRDLKIFNRAWMTVLIVQGVCLASHIANGLTSPAITTLGFSLALCSIYFVVKKGRVNVAKMTAVILISVDTIINAIVFGEQTHVIDFLLLAALCPLYFFELKNKKLIYTGIAVCLIPFALFHVIAPYLSQYALPLATQMQLYHMLTWEKAFCMVVLLYLIYNKNAQFEVDMRQKENELLGQKKQYESILEQIPIDIVTFDKDLNYTYINSAAVKDSAVREWLIGKSNVDYFKHRNMDIKGAEERDRMLYEALSKGEGVEFEEMFMDRNGTPRYSLKGASPIYSACTNELTGLVGYAFDITAIKEAEKKLKEYSAELERKNDDLHHFVNATSHDLKSPLRNIASHLQLLQRKNDDKLDDDSREMIAYTIKSMKHLNQLISDIYQYSVADRNDKPMAMSDLNEVLERSLKPLADIIASKNAVITCDNLPTLTISPSQIEALFANLVGNALKYNSSLEPHITISATTTDDSHIFSVSDNGIGIAPEYKEQIFEIFKRLHTSNEYEGTGVGLAICSKIVDTYGGKIWVESEPGKGSTFFFSLDKELVEFQNPSSHNISPYNNMAIAG
jgi:PAS domain S-box-containing protein